MKKLFRKIFRQKKAQQSHKPQERRKFDPDGKKFYDPNAEMTYQSYFDENKEAISRGEAPVRYHEIAEIVPGDRVLEIGSADGTQSLVLAEKKQAVHGLELMPQQFETSLELKDAWLALGKKVENCQFHKGDIGSNFELLADVDTVLASRVIYHLRAGIVPFFEKIEKSGHIKNLVLIGCPRREKKWSQFGETGDSMGRYAYYASLEGMIDVATKYGFEVVVSNPSSEDRDPVVVARRQ